MLKSAEETLGITSRSRNDWFDDNDVEVSDLLKSIRQAHTVVLADSTSVKKLALWRGLRAEVQPRLRQMKNSWWAENAAEIQAFAFYSAVKAVYGPTKRPPASLKSADGDLLNNDEDISRRWKEIFEGLLNSAHRVNPDFIERLPLLPCRDELDNPPSLNKVLSAIRCMKNNKAAGPDDVPAGILKFGGPGLTRLLHNLISRVWTTGTAPQSWKDAELVTIYKKKGDKQDCANYRGIALLSTAGKVLSRILLSRLNALEVLLPETQNGFRSNRSTIDASFAVKLLQEKAVEHSSGLHIAFIDLQKAFDSVNRDMFFQVLWMSAKNAVYHSKPPRWHDSSR